MLARLGARRIDIGLDYLAQDPVKLRAPAYP
jgi:hypothetical protein